MKYQEVLGNTKTIDLSIILQVLLMDTMSIAASLIRVKVLILNVLSVLCHLQ